MDKEVDCLFVDVYFVLDSSPIFLQSLMLTVAFVFIGRGRHNINFKKKIMENQEFPKGVGFAPFLRSFMSNSSISIDELAVAMTMSKYAITRLAEGKSYPTDVCYAEFCIMFTVVLGKDFDAYKKMTRKDKDDLVAKIMASGGSACTVAGMISLISASGVVAGLSAAGITSGLAAIGGVIGGGMLAGIAVVAAAPLVVGAILYSLCKPKDKKADFLLAYRYDLDPKYEINPQDNEDEDMD